jgi:two-component system CheB/CheR fusion protein
MGLVERKHHSAVPVRDANWYAGAAEHLVGVVQALSQARDVATIQDIAKTAARELTGADGATFVLRDGAKCYYADESAISPLWKGQRFPLGVCISGWVMMNGKSVVIEDIYADPRIPADAYKLTFVKSLVMVPIRRKLPIGAIGNYWAVRWRPTDRDVEILQALADMTSVAMENVHLDAELRRTVLELQELKSRAGRVGA